MIKKSILIIFFFLFLLSPQLIHAGDSPCMVWGVEKYPGECEDFQQRKRNFENYFPFVVITLTTIVYGLTISKKWNLPLKKTALILIGHIVVLGITIYVTVEYLLPFMRRFYLSL